MRLALSLGIMFFFVFHAHLSSAQIGGKRSYEFLNVPSNARLAGLGGVNVSLADRDINFVTNNPALLGDTLTGFASVNYQFFVADIGNAAFSYYNRYKGIGNLSVSVQHMRYGALDGYDYTGASTGTFNSGETALLVSKSFQQGNFRLGTTLKGVFSSIGGFRSSAVAVDLGGLFVHPDDLFSVGMVAKNLGVTISEFSETSNTKLPFDVQVGMTLKPKHMPLRFSLTAFNLITPNVNYDAPTDEADDPTTVGKLLAHLNVGGELLLHRNVNILFGYNFLNHQALKLETAGGGAGVTVGFSVKIKTVDFVFSRMGYVAGTGAYAFTLSTNVNRFF